MKILIISDIHANIKALEAVWEKENDSDLVVCAGDLVEFGAYPKEVVDWVRLNDAICVIGNHDLKIIREWRQDRLFEKIPQNKWGWIQHNASALSAHDIEWMGKLPVNQMFGKYRMTHSYGNYEDYLKIYSQDQYDQFRGDSPYSCLIVGHTHQQAIFYTEDGSCWVNPGSVSYRHGKNPDRSAHYATIVDGNVCLHRQPYKDMELHGQVMSYASWRENEKQTT